MGSWSPNQPIGLATTTATFAAAPTTTKQSTVIHEATRIGDLKIIVPVAVVFAVKFYAEKPGGTVRCS